MEMNSISIYDKSGNLVDYIEYNGEELKCYYSARGNVLSRKYVNEYGDGKEPVTVSSKLEYSDSIMLHPKPWLPETSISAIVSGGTLASINQMNIESRVDTYYSHNEGLSKVVFNVKPELIEEWSNKL